MDTDRPILFVAGSPVFARIVGALLQIEGFDLERRTAELADDWAGAADDAAAVVVELGPNELPLLARVRDACPDAPMVAMSASYADDPEALLEGERHELVAWVNLPSKLEAPLAFLARMVEDGGHYQREHHELDDVHYLVTQLVRH